MRLLLAGVLSAAVAGCATPNPRSCGDGACTDPQYPFCDVDGVFGGVKNECITVVCTAGELAGCREDAEVRCNASGANYDVTSCQLGCALASDGCKLCEPNQTACTNGQVVSCDAAGDATVEESCPLGCFDSEPRCREVDPSNGLATYLDMFQFPPDVTITDGEINPIAGTMASNGMTLDVPTFLIPAQGGRAAVRVFVVGSLQISGSFGIGIDSRIGDLEAPNGPATAILARGPITIDGVVNVMDRVGVPVSGCTATKGTTGTTPQSNTDKFAGGGGGGNATVGGRGGDVTDAVNNMFGEVGGSGGAIVGTPEIEPLQGGCSGGYENALATTYHNGGGALQLTSTTSIVVNGRIEANGVSGFLEPATNVFLTGGGGAGGSILVEAPTVTLGASASVLATGGRGAQTPGAPTMYLGSGGAGGTSTTPAVAGASVPVVNMTNVGMSGGGGGGGLGRFRINTKDGTYEKSGSTVENAAVTTGTIRSR